MDSNKWLQGELAKDFRLARYYEVMTSVRNYAPLTMVGYVSDIVQYAHFLSLQGKEVHTSEPSDLEAYMLFMSESGLSSHTISRRVHSVHSFFKFLDRYFNIPSGAMLLVQGPKLEKTVAEVMTPEEVASVIAQIPTNTTKGLRDRLILTLMYDTGIRSSEVLGLKYSSLHLAEGVARIDGKGRKQRNVILSQNCIRLLSAWLPIRQSLLTVPEAEDYIFISLKDYTQMTRYTLWRLVHNYSKRANLNKNIHPHTFRHSFATSMLDGGANLNSIQTLMGHESIATTANYLHTSMAHLKNEVASCHPSFR